MFANELGARIPSYISKRPVDDTGTTTTVTPQPTTPQGPRGLRRNRFIDEFEDGPKPKDRVMVMGLPSKDSAVWKVLDVLHSTPTGSELLDTLRRNGGRIEVRSHEEFANEWKKHWPNDGVPAGYAINGNIYLDENYLKDVEHGAGYMAHELGHVMQDKGEHGDSKVGAWFMQQFGAANMFTFAALKQKDPGKAGEVFAEFMRGQVEREQPGVQSGREKNLTMQQAWDNY